MKLTCLIIDDEPLARQLVENFASRCKNVRIIKSYDNLEGAFEFLERIKYEIDIVFLDIQVGKETSILLLAKNGIDKEVRIVFTSAFSPTIYGDYDIRYFEWLQKPIPFETFEDVVEKIRIEKYLNSNSNS
jgi:two-component SAPR family response regulator